MALAKQSRDINLVLWTGSSSTEVNYTFTIQNKDIELVPEYWGGGNYDEAITGKRISNIRGYRIGISINFDASREYVAKQVGSGSTVNWTFRQMYNDILYAYLNNVLSDGGFNFLGIAFRVNNDTGSKNAITIGDLGGTFMFFVPEDMSYVQRYSNQISRFTPTMKFTSETILTTIPSELQGIL